MNLYKITNYKTKLFHIVNEELKNQFFKINKEWNYKTENLTLLKRQKQDNFIFNIIAVLVFMFLYLALCELLNAI